MNNPQQKNATGAAVYPRQAAKSASLQPLGFWQWLKLFFGTLYAWHLTHAVSLIGIVVLMRLMMGYHDHANGLPEMLIFLAAGPFTNILLLPAVAIILLASIGGARMRTSWLRFLTAAMGIGTAMAVGAWLNTEIPFGNVLASISATLISSGVGSSAFYLLATRSRGHMEVKGRLQSGWLQIRNLENHPAEILAASFREGAPREVVEKNNG